MTELSPIGAGLRRADPDRFLCALFAPPARREALFTLYAFNNELARARDATREPMMAMIRLQWWREVVEGARRAHEIAAPLAALLDAGVLDAAELLAIIEAREAELEPVATVAEWQALATSGPGTLAMAAGRLLGRPGDERLRALGAAYAVAGMLRSLRAGRCLLPEEALAAHNLTAEAALADPAAARPALAPLAEWGRGLLQPATRFGAAVSAALPGVLARRDLRRPGVLQARGTLDRLAVMAAAATGRV